MMLLVGTLLVLCILLWAGIVLGAVARELWRSPADYLGVVAVLSSIIAATLLMVYL